MDRVTENGPGYVRQAASLEAWVVPRKTCGTRRTSLDVHRQNRKRKAEHLTGERGEARPCSEGSRGATVQGR
jgi:hypothetical protein